MRPGRGARFAAVFAAALIVCGITGGAVRADPAGGALPTPADPAAAPLDCSAPAGLAALGGAPLARSAGLVAAGKSPLAIAMGSSSTQGVGASSPAAAYPARLAVELRRAFPRLAITVVNHGRGGQDVDEEFARLARDVADAHPDLVIWQVGTNALLRREDPGVEERLLARGIELMKRHGIDVVLMDMQYAPRVLARPAWRDIEGLIAATARREDVGYFRRFELMRAWERSGQLAPAALIGRDGLHMTDSSYACIARRLAQALVAQWQVPEKLAQSPHRSPAAFAGQHAISAAIP